MNTDDCREEDVANETENDPISTTEPPPQPANLEHIEETLKNIAETGVVDVEWAELQRAITITVGIILEKYIERSTDCKEERYQEPNVEKFSLDDSKNEIFELISSFTEPPFTIQRICELLHSPFKYYDRISTFLRGLEKNLRVISSNNWGETNVIESENEPRSEAPAEKLAFTDHSATKTITTSQLFANCSTK